MRAPRAKCKEAARRTAQIFPAPEFDLLAFISVVAACERVCVYCGCSDSMGCPQEGSPTGTCSWMERHPSTPTGVCSACWGGLPAIATLEQLAWKPWVIVKMGRKGCRFLNFNQFWTPNIVQAKLFLSEKAAVQDHVKARGSFVRQMTAEELKLVDQHRRRNA